MATVSAHYDELLAELYSWMLGDFSARVEAQRSWLRGLVDDAGEPEELRPRALDLGAGAGAEAVALALLGYDVVAVDASAKLVAEMRGRVAEAGLAHRVDVVQADLVAFLEGPGRGEGRGAGPATLAICLGDTLTHLDSPATVRQMFRAARARVAAGGKLVISYRDLSDELRELDRFFLVRSDASKSLTCFVEYLPGRAVVHDIVHSRTESGWEMRKSCYPKLRLPVERVCEWLAEAGFRDVERVPCGNGLVGLVAR